MFIVVLIFFKRGLVQSYTVICRLSGGCHASQTNPAFIKESPCLNLFIIKTHSAYFLISYSFKKHRHRCMGQHSWNSTGPNINSPFKWQCTATQMRPSYFIILLCLTPDEFTRQEESAATQWLNHAYM